MGASNSKTSRIVLQWGGPQVNPQVQQMFIAVDKDRSGQINAKELQAALINSNWSPFNE
ncbi:programmed cell death protein 6 isoform 1, partial [Tropilaelaps mercedesae]